MLIFFIYYILINLGLNIMHKKFELMHSDIKPDNIMV
jgi:serine/threonine protein kinase